MKGLKDYKRAVLLAALGVILVSNCSALIAQEREVVGWMERVVIHPGGATVRAKLDTGADFSSLNASDIVEYQQDGERWISFSVTTRTGKPTRISRPIKRMATIRRHAGKSERRPVVELGICLGSTYLMEEVNLVSRKAFTTEMLIGRSFLAGTTLVDTAMTYLVQPKCRIDAEEEEDGESSDDGEEEDIIEGEEEDEEEETEEDFNDNSSEEE